MGAVVGLSIAVFTSSHPLTYIVFPVLIVAAVYLGQRGATVALVLAFAVAVAMTASNVGPFVERSINDEALSTHLYILVATLTTLTLAAAISAQRHDGIELAGSFGACMSQSCETTSCVGSLVTNNGNLSLTGVLVTGAQHGAAINNVATAASARAADGDRFDDCS